MDLLNMEHSHIRRSSSLPQLDRTNLQNRQWRSESNVREILVTHTKRNRAFTVNSKPGVRSLNDPSHTFTLSYTRKSTIEDDAVSVATVKPECASEHTRLSPSLIHVDYEQSRTDYADTGRRNEACAAFILPNPDNIYVANEKMSNQTPKSNQRQIKVQIKTQLRKMRQLLTNLEQTITPSDVKYGTKEKTPKKSLFQSSSPLNHAPISTAYVPIPQKGQSLMSFLQSEQFSNTNAQLDRENAHFYVCEAMIAAVECIKFNNSLPRVQEIFRRYGFKDDAILDIMDKSDTSIDPLEDYGKNERIFPTSSGLSGSAWSFNSPVRSPTRAYTSQSMEDTLASSYGDFDIDDLNLDSASTMAGSRSLSMASLASDTDYLRYGPRGTPDGQSDCTVSAENVAISLINKFHTQRLPKASDLKWLVSERDANQRLLPLPTSVPVDVDMPTDNLSALRGTNDWAPPRAQIIFTPQPKPSQKLLLAKQNNQCAGCGVKVSMEFAKKYRYCNYLGRYFCTGCHTNQLALIPGKILFEWDFKRYRVCNFSYKLLDAMFGDPLFNITDINPDLYRFRKCKQLEKCRNLRKRIYYMKDYIMHCRYASNFKSKLLTIDPWLINQIDIYSIQALLAVQQGDFYEKLRGLCELCNHHICDCELCNIRGFYCEICESKEIIFPWELETVHRCGICGTCYHIKCFNIMKQACKRCYRLSIRKAVSRDIPK